MPGFKLSVDVEPRRLFCRTADDLSFLCEIPECISFPCYIEDYGTYLLVFSAGVKMVIATPDKVATSKDTIVSTKRLGKGYSILGDFDSLTLGEMDRFSFDELTLDTADWLVLTTPAAKFGRLQTLGDFDRFTLGELDNLPLL